MIQFRRIPMFSLGHSSNLAMLDGGAQTRRLCPAQDHQQSGHRNIRHSLRLNYAFSKCYKKLSMSEDESES